MSTRFHQMAAVTAAVFFCASAWAQSGTENTRPAAVIPFANEAAPKLIAYAALPDPLARGVVIIQHRTENLRVLPVFGQKAVDVSPHLGHIHVTVDDWPGTWAHTSQDPIIIVGLKPGKHNILLELADPAHKILTSEKVAVTVPDLKAPAEHQHGH